MMIRAVPLFPLVLAACAAAGPAPLLPVAAALDGAVLTLDYADGTACQIFAPAGLPLGETWTDGFADCPGVTAVEVVLWETEPEAVILRIADVEAPLTVTGLPPLALAEVWAAHPEGFWVHFTVRP